MDELMSIGDFSARSGLSPKRLRSYAASGLLTPEAVHPDTAYRYYSPGQLEDARLIDALRDAGIPLAEISLLLRHRDPELLAGWAERLRDDAERRHEALDQALALLGCAADRLPTGRTPVPYLDCAGRTDIGLVRENNEDAIVTGRRLVAVADGLGGHAGGELASRLATDHAVGHPHRGVLTRALGVAPEVTLDAASRSVAPGDRLVLCSDGLFNHVPDDELASLALAAAGPQAAVDALRELGLARGGEDNLSVIVADVRA